MPEYRPFGARALLSRPPTGWATTLLLVALVACRDGQAPAASSAASNSSPTPAAEEGSRSTSEMARHQVDTEPRASSEKPAKPMAKGGAGDRASETEKPRGWPKLEPPDIERDFCTERVHTLDADACFALPAKRTKQLLIYLHGIVPPTRESVQKTNFEAVVANGAERAGVVALIPRGEQGFAPQAYPGWWGWPTGKHSFAKHGEDFVAKIRAKRQKLERTLEHSFQRVFLAGSSSGAYFVVAVALFGAMPEVDGFGVISGGAGYRTEGFAELPAKPVYIGFGKHDSVADGARALGRQLERAGWPVKLGVHPLPHGAREIYLDEAFQFWAQH